MKVFTNKKIIKKVAIILIIITAVSFILTKSVKADAEQIGGKLLNPVMSLFVSLGDSAMSMLQKVVYGMDESLVNLNTTAHWWSKVIVIGITVLAVIAAVAATVLTAGAAAGVIATAGAIVSGIATTITIVGVSIITFPVTTELAEGMLPGNFYLPFYSISPERIFSNEIAMLDVDFFNPVDTRIIFSDGTYIKTKNIHTKEISEKLKNDKDATIVESTATELRSTISNWYQILRNISLVALLSVLVYIGIRILISSTSNDKAKYKQFLLDWVVAICLLFVMQYIMSGSNFLVGKITDLVSSSVDKGSSTQPEIFVITDSKKIKSAYKIFVEDPVNNGEIQKAEDSAYYSYFKNEDGTQNAGKDAKMLLWPAENWLQQARIQLQKLNKDSKTETFVTIGWKLIYVVLVAYTVLFMFTYIKRVVYMAFLTVIAPLVALTYPIDKMNDGKAQAFNMWFKEYIFNLLIQPMHLIIYTVLVGSAMNLASKNIIYVACCLGFMVPAEKLLRKFFGFEKAGTPGIFAGPAGAAAAMGMVHKLFGKPPHGPRGGEEIGKGFSENSKLDDKSKIKYQEVENGLFENNDQKIKKMNLTPEQEQRNDLDKRTEEARQKQIQEQYEQQQNEMRNQQQIENSNKNAPNRLKEPDDIQKMKVKKPNRVGRALNAGLRYYGNGMKNKIKKRGLKELTFSNLARKTAGIASATVGGIGGIIGGAVVGGDITKGLQYGTGAAVGGYKFADATVKNVADSVGVDGTFDYMKQNMYTSEEWNDKQIDKNIKDFQNNFENKEYIRNKFDGNKEQMERFMKDVVPKCQKYGLTDMKDAETYWDMRQNEKDNVSDGEILNAIQASKDYGKNTTKLSAKEDKEYNDTLLMRANGNSEVAGHARKLIDKASKIRYDYSNKE